MRARPLGQRAALYLRSSKDRKDVSIEAQRRQLQQLAADRGYFIVTEYADVVESGKDEHRPGFQRMLAELKHAECPWSVLLMLDTARLARRRLTSIMFEELEAKRHGITIVYKNLPDLEAAESMLLRNQLQGLDEYHSLVSKRKGLSGMATNIENGYRAGGRAPYGYRLRHLTTGAVREGADVLKSVLEPAAGSTTIARYLKARAAGASRQALVAELALPLAPSTLIGIEWNALTYAGHTVWNVHNEYTRGRGYKDGKKRRPSSEWIVKRDTHAALISDDEAAVLLAQLEQSPHKPTRRTKAAYLLTGLLVTPDGGTWHGNGAGRYRMKANRRNVPQQPLEGLVVDRVVHDLLSHEFAETLAEEAQRAAAAARADPGAALRSQLTTLMQRISRLMDLAAKMTDPDPALREIEGIERQRKQLANEIALLDRERAASASLGGYTAARMQQLLAGTAEQLRAAQDRENAKDLLRTLVEKIVLDPATLNCQIHYKISVRNTVASPRGSAAIPILRIITRLQLAA
jgi:site-specific DNA recombinase